MGQNPSARLGQNSIAKPASAAWDEVQTTGTAWNKAAADLCASPPQSLADLAAKAFAVALVIRASVGDPTHPERFDENAQLHERLALALALDVMAMNARLS